MSKTYTIPEDGVLEVDGAGPTYYINNYGFSGHKVFWVKKGDIFRVTATYKEGTYGDSESWGPSYTVYTNTGYFYPYKK